MYQNVILQVQMKCDIFIETFIWTWFQIMFCWCNYLKQIEVLLFLLAWGESESETKFNKRTNQEPVWAKRVVKSVNAVTSSRKSYWKLFYGKCYAWTYKPIQAGITLSSLDFSSIAWVLNERSVEHIFSLEDVYFFAMKNGSHLWSNYSSFWDVRYC